MSVPCLICPCTPASDPHRPKSMASFHSPALSLPIPLAPSENETLPATCRFSPIHIQGLSASSPGFSGLCSSLQGAAPGLLRPCFPHLSGGSGRELCSRLSPGLPPLSWPEASLGTWHGYHLLQSRQLALRVRTLPEIAGTSSSWLIYLLYHMETAAWRTDLPCSVVFSVSGP